MREKLILVFVLAASTLVYGQRASIKKVELAGEKIIVHYDLEDSNPAHVYQINLYASQSNFATALTKVTGDVGNEIKPGPDKKIEWRIREELGPYKGKLSLEIRGRMVIPVARINSVSSGEKFKRGKAHLITWEPGNRNAVNIELLKKGEPVATHLGQPNNGSYALVIPANAAIGKDYALRITDTKDADNVAFSQTFTVTRKIPLLLKVVPVIAIGGAAAVLLGSGGSGGADNPGTGNGDIPLPPPLSGN